jgi:hypothetical protein
MTPDRKRPRRIALVILRVLTGLATAYLRAGLDRFFPEGDWHTVLGDLFIVATWPALMWLTLFCGKRGIHFWLWV